MKAVFFDWDGTLVDTCGMVLDAHNHVRKIHNLPLWEAEDIFGRVSRSARETYPKIYGDRAAEAQKQLYDKPANTQKRPEKSLRLPGAFLVL